MIALTKEKREELIEVIEESLPIMRAQLISPYSRKDMMEHIKIYEVALASLTADPVNPADCFDPVYLFPPVPEINFPDKDKLPGWARDHEDALDWYEAEIKIINGLGGVE